MRSSATAGRLQLATALIVYPPIYCSPLPFPPSPPPPPQAGLKVAGGGSGLLRGIAIDQNPTAALRQHVFFPEYGVGIVLRAMVKSAKKLLAFFETLNAAIAAVQAMACIHLSCIVDSAVQGWQVIAHVLFHGRDSGWSPLLRGPDC